MPRTRSAYKAELVRRSLIFQNQLQLPENITSQHLTNGVSNGPTLVAPVLVPAQFSKTTELYGHVSVVKQNEAVQNVASAINQSRSTCDELLRVLPLELRFDQGPQDRIFSTLVSLEEYLEKVDIGGAVDKQHFPNPDEHVTANSFGSQYPCRKLTDEFNLNVSTPTVAKGHDALVEESGISTMTLENSFLGNSSGISQTDCSETLKIRQGSTDIGHSLKDDKAGHRNKNSTDTTTKPVQYSGRRYNTRSADGTRKPKIMFDGFVTELPKKRKLINIAELEERKCGKWSRSNKVVSGKAKGFDSNRDNGGEMGEGNVPAATSEEIKQPLKLPTIPKGSFGYFFEDFYREYKIKSPDQPLNQVMKYAGMEWRGMSEDDKKKYRDRQNAARIRYRSEMKVFNEQYLKSKHFINQSTDNGLKKRPTKVKDKLPKKSSKAKGKLPASLYRAAEKLVETFTKASGNTSEMFTVRQKDHLPSSNQLPYGVPGPSTFDKDTQNSHMQCGESGSRALINLYPQANGISSSNGVLLNNTLSGSSALGAELELCSIKEKGETSSPTVGAIESIFERSSKGNESTQSSFFMYPGRKMISQIKNAKKCDSSEQSFESNEGIVHKRKRTVH